MDAQTELEGGWFERGETLAEIDEAELEMEPAPRPNLWARFGLAFAGAGAFLVGVAALLQ